MNFKNQGFTKLSKQQMIEVIGGNVDDSKTNPTKNDCGNNNQKNGPITSPYDPGGTPLEICTEG
jgi:hypothetical protein